MQKYITRLLIFTAVLSLIVYGLFTVLEQFYLPIVPYLIAFFASISALVHFILLKASNYRITKFSTFFMGSVTLKLFMYIIFLVVYVLFDRENAVPFLITFFVFYLAFTIFETISLLIDLKEKN